MALGRTARGLPRYYMDVGWYRARRFLGLPIDALFLFEAIIGYCTQHATNGHIPADIEDLAAALGLRVSAVRKAVKPLLEQRHADLRPPLIRDGTEYVVPDWAEHNPTARETDDYYANKSAAGTYGNHKRWHLDRGEHDPTCPHCTSDRKPVAPAIANGSQEQSHLQSQTESHGLGWDRKTPNSSSLKTHAMAVDNDPDDPLGEIWIHYANLAWARQPPGAGINNPVGWKLDVAEQARIQHHTLAASLHADYDITPRELAECLLDGALPPEQSRRPITHTLNEGQ